MLFAVVCFAGCSSDNSGGAAQGDNSDLKIGFITIGDDIETYTKAHMDGIKAAAADLGIDESQLIWKTNIQESEDCYNAAKELVASGCKLVVSNSYGHQVYMADAAEEFPDVNFCFNDRRFCRHFGSR